MGADALETEMLFYSRDIETSTGFLKNLENWMNEKEKKPQSQWIGAFKMKSIWRRERESNPRITILQTVALPLGYPAVGCKEDRVFKKECQRFSVEFVGNAC